MIGVAALLTSDLTLFSGFGLGTIPMPVFALFFPVPLAIAKSQELVAPVAVGTVCAFIGAFAGKRVLQKVTLHTVQVVVAAAMLLTGSGLVAGLV